MLLIPFRPKKGKPFRVYFNNDRNVLSFNPTFFSKNISKDGGTFETLTNNPVYISDNPDNTSANGIYALGSKGNHYIDLTADEMDADVIVLNLVQYNSTPSQQGEKNIITIYTDSFTGFGFGNIALSTKALNALGTAISKQYVVARQSFNDNGYHYIGLVKSNGLWLIIRQTEDLLETKFRLNRESTETFDSAWNNRATITYDENEPI